MLQIWETFYMMSQVTKTDFFTAGLFNMYTGPILTSQWDFDHLLNARKDHISVGAQVMMTVLFI